MNGTKIIRNNFAVSVEMCTFAPQFRKVIDDSVAQPVEHNTFNVGVLGSNPSWITEERSSMVKTFSF